MGFKKNFLPTQPRDALRPKTYDRVVETVLVDGTLVNQVRLVERTESPNENLDARDFQISAYVASGNVQALGGCGMFEVNAIDNANSLASSASRIHESLNTPENG